MTYRLIQVTYGMPLFLQLTLLLANSSQSNQVPGTTPNVKSTLAISDGH